MYIDSHAHLEFPEFDEDRTAMLERAWKAGVRRILAIGSGTGPHDLEIAVRFAEQYDWVHATVGIHPHEAHRAESAHYEALAQLCRRKEVLAVGEIGLDYYYEELSRPIQKKVLIRQLDLAAEEKLPVIFHCRDKVSSCEAWDDLREIVLKAGRSTEKGGILHCFTGTWEDAKMFLDAGFYVSFAGNVTFKKSDDLRAVARQIPLDRLLIETDSPFLSPVPFRGKRNEPARVKEVARVLAEVKGITKEEMARHTSENFLQLFGLEN